MHSTAGFFFSLSLNKLDLAGKEGWKEERGRNNSTRVHVLFRSSPPRGSSALEKTGVEFIIPVPLGVSRWLLIAVIDKPACIQLGMDPQAENPEEAINTSHIPHPPYRPKLCADSEDLANTFLGHINNSSLMRPDQLSGDSLLRLQNNYLSDSLAMDNEM